MDISIKTQPKNTPCVKLGDIIHNHTTDSTYIFAQLEQIIYRETTYQDTLKIVDEVVLTGFVLEE